MCIAGCTEPKSYPEITYVNFTAEVSALANKPNLSTTEYRNLRARHGRFFDLWINEILDFGQYGQVPDSIKAEVLHDFLVRNKPVFQSIAKHYAKYPNLVRDVSNAFGKLNELIGDVRKPVLYSYFSQFSNYNTFIDTNKGKTVLAFSSEMFMNDTFPLYKMLEVPEFFNRYNSTNQLPAMLLWNYLKGRYETVSKSQQMLDEAIFNGKIWYTMEQVLGSDKIWETLGYTKKEWEQMIAEEGQIWRHYLSGNALFNSNFNEYKRYFAYGNRTFGAGIPPDCPPLIGNFTGYRIVSAYMQKQDKQDIKALWKEKDASKILKASAYNPIK